MLPIAKKDVVKGKYLFVCLIEICGFALMAVAAALDALQIEEMVGCIAGDDTIMAAIRTNEATAGVMARIREMLRS